MKLEPFGSKVLVARDEFKYQGMIKIPDSAKSKPTIGTVVAVGPECIKVRKGMKVFFTHMSGTQVMVMDKSHPRADPDTGMVEWVLLEEAELIAMVLDDEGQQIEGRYLYARD